MPKDTQRLDLYDAQARRPPRPSDVVIGDVEPNGSPMVVHADVDAVDRTVTVPDGPRMGQESRGEQWKRLATAALPWAGPSGLSCPFAGGFRCFPTLA
jgi:hypothetical protein